MKKDDISRLLQHYLSAKEEGKEPYFDADQIDEMLDSFEDSNDYTCLLYTSPSPRDCS